MLPPSSGTPHHTGPVVFNAKDLNQYDFPSSDDEPFSQVPARLSKCVHSCKAKHVTQIKLGTFSSDEFFTQHFFPCSLTFCMVPLGYFQFAWFWNSIIIIIIIFLQSGSSCYAAIRFISYKAKRTGKVFTQQEELGGSVLSFYFLYFLYFLFLPLPENWSDTRKYVFLAAYCLVLNRKNR